ncbi:methylated-DNA--[protein]-cysteine S-methyltransferase [Fictibacillus sp. b24]|uniref:methylated-DNA--[protein]-cysteine S-methyltransferase n=1 Tax=Fictibacillus sp. b24 TaxID=3055863 RepID=UPI0025A3054F|nr:methylated-DNA--[protein]-cysteine S-methyltransferase [Fictibacillus sp. b24]MDM5317455.1 methylated-DNA--[protein]-cysteine S-methyltransferase [Fictibacillus sp. b24]
MSKLFKLDYESPIGVLEMVSSEDTVYSIMFVDRLSAIEHQREIPAVLQDCCTQLHEYFLGKRKTFTFAYKLNGTPFQQAVWDSLLQIPFAKTASYRDIANMLQNEKAVRAVGSANGRNKLSIIIPCHRIIGTNGKLTGYAGGLWRKEWLLNHEKSLKELIV